MEIFIGVTSFLIGVFSMLFYLLSRMMRSDGWDDSNITNALRLLSHVTLHPEDFGKMYYLYDWQIHMLTAEHDARLLRRPFWYVDKDELSEVVKTRP